MSGEALRQSKADAKGSDGADPENAIAHGDFLAGAHVTPRDNAIEGRGDARFFQFQLQRLQRGLGIDQVLAGALSLEFIGLDLVAGMLKLLLGDELSFHHLLIAVEIGLEHLGLVLPAFNVSFQTLDLGPGGVTIGRGLAVIE